MGVYLAASSYYILNAPTRAQYSSYQNVHLGTLGLAFFACMFFICERQSCITALEQIKIKETLERIPIESFKNLSVSLILQASYDHNGALDKNILPTPKHPIFYRKVSSIEECNDVIDKLKSQGNKIHECWINAHGAPQGIAFGFKSKNGILDQSNISLFSSGLLKLEEGSDIILLSCRTGGRTNDGSKNIGCLISEQSVSRVHCPSFKCTEVRVIKTNPLSIIYYVTKTSLIASVASVYEKGMLLKYT